MYMLYATQTHGRVYNLHDKLLMHWRNGPKWIYFYFSLMRRFVKKLLQALTLYITFDGQGREKERERAGEYVERHHITCRMFCERKLFFFFFYIFLAALVYVSLLSSPFLYVIYYSLLCTSPDRSSLSCSCTHFNIFLHLFRQLIFFLCGSLTLSFHAFRFIRFGSVPFSVPLCSSQIRRLWELFSQYILFFSHIHPFDGHNIIQSVYH